MLDIKLFRTEPDRVREGLKRRLSDPDLVQPVIDTDAALRGVKTQVEELKAELNQVSKQIPTLMREGKREEAEGVKARGRELGEQISGLDDRARVLQTEIDDLLFKIPNLPSEDTPEGPEENFKIVREAGELRKFDFAPKAHWDIATGLGLIDFARGTKLSGSGFVLYRGMGARLERALVQFMIDLHIERHGY